MDEIDDVMGGAEVEETGAPVDLGEDEDEEEDDELEIPEVEEGDEM